MISTSGCCAILSESSAPLREQILRKKHFPNRNSSDPSCRMDQHNMTDRNRDPLQAGVLTNLRHRAPAFAGMRNGVPGRRVTCAGVTCKRDTPAASSPRICRPGGASLSRNCGPGAAYLPLRRPNAPLFVTFAGGCGGYPNPPNLVLLHLPSMTHTPPHFAMQPCSRCNATVLSRQLCRRTLPPFRIHAPA